MNRGRVRPAAGEHLEAEASTNMLSKDYSRGWIKDALDVSMSRPLPPQVLEGRRVLSEHCGTRLRACWPGGQSHAFLCLLRRTVQKDARSHPVDNHSSTTANEAAGSVFACRTTDYTVDAETFEIPTDAKAGAAALINPYACQHKC